LAFANEIKKKRTRHGNQEEISGRGNVERAAMFKERHEITEFISFWGVHFIRMPLL
jgi:hypothetical protein